MPSSPAALHTHVFGPVADAATPSAARTPTVLAIHGVTGHGLRWATLADDLPGTRVLAPDLLGHGRSPWQPPWRIEDHVAALAAVVDAHLPADGSRLVIVGHSFGGAVAIALATHLDATRPGLVGGLVLLDPAQGLDPQIALTIATDSLDHWDYPDADAARAAKRAEGWADVPDVILEREIADHLVTRPGGRVGWRISAPAVATTWSELVRSARLPPPGTDTDVVIADRVDPPFVRADFVAACHEHRPAVRFTHADCEHMVPFLARDLTAEIVRRHLMVARDDLLG